MTGAKHGRVVFHRRTHEPVLWPRGFRRRRVAACGLFATLGVESCRSAPHVGWPRRERPEQELAHRVVERNQEAAENVGTDQAIDADNVLTITHLDDAIAKLK